MRRRRINLPGPRWLQFIVIVILADVLIFGIVAGTCFASGRCSTRDWSDRMFWGGMAAFGIGIPAVGASLMGLAGSSGVGDNPLAMGMEAAVMNDVIRYEQGARAKRMKFFWWFFAIGAGALLSSMLISQFDTRIQGGPPDFSKPDNAIPAKVVGLFKEEIDRSIKFLQVSGLTVAVWDGSAPVFLDNYGATGTDINARYAIGGLTEQFTAAAVMQLVQAGDLALDGLITVYLPELPDSYGFIILKDLLNHTSGLPGDAEVMDTIQAVLGEDPWQSEVTYTTTDFFKLSEEAFPELLTEPGTTYHHSEQGYRILGMIIEAASGESYNDYIATHVLTPAGLSATSPCEVDSSNVTTGHTVESNLPIEVALPNTSYAYASGNLCSTAADLVQWQYSLSSYQIINAQSLQAMYAPATGDNGKAIKAEEEDLVGLGSTISQHSQTGVGSSSTGSVPGYEAVMHFYHTQNLTIVILSDTTVPNVRRNSGEDLSRIVNQIIWAMDDNWMLE